MTVNIQIIALSFSFLFGFIFYYLNTLNQYIIKNKKKIYQSIITILFMYNIVLLYIIMLYKINHGIFHPYFFILLILGYISNKKFTKKVLSNVKLSRFIEKHLKKWYTIKNRGDIYQTQSNQKRKT